MHTQASYHTTTPAPIYIYIYIYIYSHLYVFICVCAHSFLSHASVVYLQLSECFFMFACSHTLCSYLFEFCEVYYFSLFSLSHCRHYHHNHHHHHHHRRTLDFIH
uniref:Uncharacterized protein n=1 Tax=Octopus bimaculoides TaxID=37653 RepID=A0A0L8GF09_OCTBM